MMPSVAATVSPPLPQAPAHSGASLRLDANGCPVLAACAMPLRYPDLNDPLVRRLPIGALALAIAMIDASAADHFDAAQGTRDACDAGHP